MRAWGAQNKPGAAVPAAARSPKTILVLGDSLSAEYGLARGSGWVALLQKRLAAQKIPVKVQNASISGETTSGGRSRLAALLAADKPGIVILELGANDALRGLPLSMTQDNLNQMTRAAQKSGAKALLLGMQVPPNYGSEYASRFAAIYGEVAKADKAALVPFFLKGVADAPNAAELFQSDGLHPIAAAHPTLLNNVWPQLKKLLE
ncbi:MAG TPA: arylesterase [Rhodoferax sp.]|nr:arylesterase [Rhodoferax sp.]